MRKNLLFLVAFVSIFVKIWAQVPCPPNITLQIQPTNVACFGGNTGSATAIVTGGSGNYAYSWTPIGGNTATAVNLPAGAYSVLVLNTTTTGGGTPQTVYSQNFNSTVTGWTLNTPTGTNGTDPNFWTVSDNEGGVLPPGCGMASNGNATLHVTSVFNPSGGASYDAGGLCGILFCPLTAARSESPNISTIGYTGMTLTFNYIGNGQGTIDNASLLYSTNGGTTWTTLAASLKSSICASGQGQWTAASYSLPTACENISNLRIAFNWVNNDDGVGSDPSFAVDNIQITTGGTTTTTVCSLTGTTTITQPTSPLAATISTVGVSCTNPNSGSATVAASGGTPNYTYSWSNGQTGATITNLAAGTYTCFVKDANNCTFNTTATIAPAQNMTVSVTATNVLCFGQNIGTATVTVSGGTAPYTYSWSNGQSSATISGLAGGTYICTVQDAAGCSSMTSATVTSPSSALSLSLNPQNPGCTGANDGTITASVSGGTANYTFSWSNGATGSALMNLAAGTYTCFVKDANNCTTQQTVTLTQAGGLSTAISSTPTTMGGSTGTATVTVSGGATPYTYTWNTVPVQYTATATGLAAGIYTCTIKDGNGCIKTVTVSVEGTSAISPAAVGFDLYFIAPNPTTNFLEIHAELAQNQDIQLEFYDINGKLMIEKSLGNVKEINENMDLSNFTSGIYLLKISTEKGTLMDKIIKW